MNVLRRLSVTSGFLQIALILFFVEFVRGAYLITYLPVYSSDRLGFSLSVIGIAVAAHYITDTTLKSLIGYLLDRFSPRLIVHVGLMISFAGLFATHYVHQPWLLIVAAALFGAGVSPIWIVSMSMVREGERAAQMGFLYTLWLTGMGLGPVVMNFLVDRGFGLPFWIQVGMWGVAWGMSLRIASGRLSAADRIPLRRQIRLFWQRMKQMNFLLPGMVLQTTAAGMLVPILPSFATKYLGLTYTEYSYILMAGGVSAVIGLIPMGKLSDTRGKKWFLVVGFGLLSFALYSLTLRSGLYASIIWAVVSGGAYAALLPAWNALLSYQIPDGQEGLGWGIFSSVEGIGVMLGPIMGGWLADWRSESFTVLTSALLLASIALFYMMYPFDRFAERDARSR